MYMTYNPDSPNLDTSELDKAGLDPVEVSTVKEVDIPARVIDVENFNPYQEGAMNLLVSEKFGETCGVFGGVEGGLIDDIIKRMASQAIAEGRPVALYWANRQKIFVVHPKDTAETLKHISDTVVGM